MVSELREAMSSPSVSQCRTSSLPRDLDVQDWRSLLSVGGADVSYFRASRSDRDSKRRELGAGYHSLGGDVLACRGCPVFGSSFGITGELLRSVVVPYKGGLQVGRR